MFSIALISTVKIHSMKVVLNSLSEFSTSCAIVWLRRTVNERASLNTVRYFRRLEFELNDLNSGFV